MEGRFWIGVGVLLWMLPLAAQPPEAVGGALSSASASPVATPSGGPGEILGASPASSVSASSVAASTSGTSSTAKGKPHPLLGALLALALPPLLAVGIAVVGALLTVVHIFWPRLVHREYEVLIERPARALGWGIGWLVGYAILAGLLSRAAGLGQLLSLLLSLATLAAIFLGLAGTAVSLGGQVLALAGREGVPPLARLAVGSTLIGLVSLFPLFGQLLVLYLLIIGLGAFRLAVTSLPLPVPTPAEMEPTPQQSPDESAA